MLRLHHEFITLVASIIFFPSSCKCALNWIMKESLITYLSLKIWDVCWLGLMVLGLTTLHQVLNIFLPENLSHSLLSCYWEVDMAGCCNWAIGLCRDSWIRDNDMVLDSEEVFLFLWLKERTISAVCLPPPHYHLNMSKGLWARWECSWIMTVLLWASECGQ